MSLFGTSPFDLLLPDRWMVAYFGTLALLPLLLLAFLALRRRGKPRFSHAFVPAEPSVVPPDLARFGQPWLGRLAYLGFPATRIMRSPDDADSESIHWLLVNAKDQAAGVLTGSLPASGGKPAFSLRLMTFLSDGRVIVTADRMTTRRPPAHWNLAQRRFQTLEIQAQEHRARVDGLANGAAAILPPPADLASRLAAEDRAEFDALQASGDYAACGPDALKPALSRLPRLACQDFAAIFTGSALPSGRRKDVASAASAATPGEDDIAPLGAALSLSPEQLVERDLLRYRKHTDQVPGGKHLFFRLLILVAILVFFTATFGRESPVTTVAMLLGLIAVHEFGHWLAMKIFGYSRMGRFFVPFIGPVDRGRKLNATPWQQILVILAGPVPGLMAGLAVLVAGFFLPAMPLWLLDLGGLAVVLNAFHLLPFLPLDGGKIVDLLVFRDLPLLRPAFTAVSAIATLLASFLLHSKAIRVIAAAMFAGLIWDIKMIKVVRGGRRLGWAGAIDDEDDALRRIFRGVREEENEGFLRSHDWQRQIDVLLAEVLRKRPGIFTRFFGGALYWICCGLPILLVIGVFALPLVGGLGSIGRYEADSAEFKAAFPVENRSITEVQLGAIEVLVAATRESAGETLPTTEQRPALAASAAPRIGASLDKLDWTAAAIAHHADRIDPAVLSIWLEVLCGKLEAATRDGRQAEATRRAEVLLYGIGAMEPALTLAHRELLWNAELRTLSAIENLSATGTLDATTLTRLESRLLARNIAPLPEVDNLLLVGGWGEAQMERLLGITGEATADAGAVPAIPDARFWRHAYPHLRRLSETGFSLRGGTPATVALARHWKQSRQVGLIPPQLGEPVAVSPGEAEFILAFCEGHRRLAWRRQTALSALRLEAYRQKSGAFPPLWKHTVPGGAMMELVQTRGPLLRFTDIRNQLRSRIPFWLSPASLPMPPSTPALDYDCLLFGAR